MNSFFDHISDFTDRELQLSIMECEYNCNLALHNYITESSLLDSGIIVCENADNANPIEASKNNKFIQFIKRIADSVRKLTTAFVDMLKNMKQKDDITFNDYMNSIEGRVQLSKDYAAINNKIEKEILEGRKIIKGISKGTGIDPKIVAEYCDKAGNAALKYGPAVLSVGTIFALKKITRNSIEKSCGEISSCEKELRYDAEKKLDKMERNEKEKEYYNKYKGNTDKVQKKMNQYDQQKEISSVFNAMAKNQAKLVANAREFINEVKNKANKNN